MTLTIAARVMRIMCAITTSASVATGRATAQSFSPNAMPG